ncbi:S8 family serine peptidase [Actinacidiphila glaucinigra]|uniref:S8 family serine peptidase n=1 Tax=Actinacidiphila glaucinigra TaxID=235986 RepID=UPI001FECC1F5|nr:S8 family serine peptidase [Actinacidiphila glaucinigra]
MTPGAAQGAAPSAPDANTSTAAAAAQRPPATVTLITGDKVMVAQGPKGTAPAVQVERAPGATGSVRVATEGGDTYVYPSEAMAYIATGRLDKQLFNVTQLMAQGYDDAHLGALPLIVTRTEGSAALRKRAELPGAQTTLSLPSVRGEAVRAKRSKAADFWSALTGTAQAAGQPSARLAAEETGEAGEAPRFSAGVDQVWLDGKAKATLADTTAQVGAPAAWAAGGTGAGVRVAVLDSGADTTHPDLVDRIVATRSFVPGDDVIDRNGHGTHTASTVAGTGAASGGKEQGVAPGADLLVGKVLGDNGSGTISGIIAGMEWATRTEHAKVVSMSLGVSGWHTQDDPMSQAVNRLSAETGALFVIAAGNDGPGAYSVAAPGTADAALTVGAVDASDHLAEFSSAGPRMNDDALKPDMTAPGVDVLAARSQYMEWGEGFYRVDSGTSMATPHVAGAAVLLAQKHPGWTGRQIKDALMGTSVPTPGYSPYVAGTGRLNVAAAYGQDQVVATGSVDAGLVRWSPGTQRQPVKRKITYTNTTDRPVTLRLSVDRGDSPAQAFALSADRVTVPANGTATAEVVANAQGLAAGQYAARVTARHAGGEVHTAVGISVESEKHDLTIRLKDRDGRPVSGEVEIRSADGASTYMWVPDGSLTSRWAPGSYMVSSLADVQGLGGRHSLGLAVLTAPEVELTGARVVELDASRARQVKVATPRPTSVASSRIDLYRSFTSATPTPGDGNALRERIWPSAAYDSLWALPTKDKVRKGSFAFTTRIRAEQRPLAITYRGRLLDDALVQPGSRPLRDGTSRLDAVFAGNGTQAEYAGVSARGRAVVIRGGGAVTPADQAAAARAAGAVLLLVVNDGEGRGSDWYGDPDKVTTGQVPVASLTLDEGEALIREVAAAGGKGLRLAVEAHPAPAYLYDLLDQHLGGVPADPSARTEARDLARVDLDFTPPPGRRVTESRLDFPSYDYAPYKGFSPNALPAEVVAPGRRTDFVTAGVQWQQNAGLDGWGGSSTDLVTYRPGSVQKDRWFGPITRPRMITSDLPYRGENAMSAYIQGFGDAGSAHSGGSGMYQAISFYQGDRELSRIEGYPWFGVGDLAPEKLPYRLVVDTKGDTALSPYSTATRTEWRFTSGAPETVQAVPLVQLDYGTDLDAEGRAERRTELAVTPVVLGGQAAGDAVSSVRLEVSYDDGATWLRQGLKEKKGTWQASLNAPGRAGYVSIRVTAEQRNGGGVTQTVTRAFGLK